MTTPAVAQRAACPACGAATRLGDPWCTLCYADLSPAAPEPAVHEPEVPAGAAEPAAQVAAPSAQDVGSAAATAPDPTEQAGAEAAEATGGSPLDAVTMPCPACDTQVPILVSNCPVCGTDMLAPLRGGDRTHQNQVVRELMAMSRAARLSLAAGIAVALLVVFFGVTAIV